MSTLAVPGDAVASGRGAFSIFILAVAAFVIVTTEYLIVGLLPALARDLGISISLAGQLVTLFAFTVMLFGPVLTALLSHVDRKRLFVAILLVFTAANVLAALAPNIWVLALARFIPALALPVFWGTASETAGQLAGPQRAGRAVSQVYLGISAALLFGIPLGTLAADAIGWRGAFWGLAALSLAMALLIAIFMPTLARPRRLRLAEQARILKDPHFIANVALSVVVFTAMFTAYTYLADTLERIAGVAPAHVGWWLMGFGAIGLAGNWLGGRLVDRRPLRATLVFTLLLGLGMAASVPVAHTLGLLVVALAVWGVAYTALFPVCQVRVMKAASHAQALAGTLNVSAANAGIGLGAIVGGLVIAQWGLGRVGYVSAAIAILAMLMVPWVARLASQSDQEA
ncbi:MFS transporter [Bordetella genomosp. 8]|uniref:MFS transporter n=1 Tax=Bordetella genomosp. 8 TaxID=1416806 RepID=A0A1W6YMG8_9BORD|nr:MFS transporter [Bordetella genomosp. 8]ARP82300.1 MFS transporter [Bordetella genomosp. 8]